jgi:adenylate cyclase
MSMPSEGIFVSQGGVPSRLTQPEPSPLTRAASLQAQVAHELADLRGEMSLLSEQLQQVEGMLATLRQQGVATQLTSPLTHTREVAVRLTRVAALLAELERALAIAGETIQTLRAERGQLQALCVIAEHLNATIDRNTLLVRSIDDLLALVHADRGGVVLAAENGTRLHFEAARAANQQSLSRGDFAMDWGIVEQVWRTQTPMLINDVPHDPRVAGLRAAAGPPVQALMCSPLRAMDAALGVVYVDVSEPHRAFAEQHLDLLAAFCNEAAIAINNAELFARQRRQTQEIAAIKNYTDSILASINSGVLAIDNEGHITRANQAVEQMLGMAVRTMLGSPMEMALGVLPDPNLAERIRAFASEREPVATVVIEGSVAGHGESRTISVAWSALQDPEKRRLGTVIVLDDLTELARARQTEQIVRRYVHPDVMEMVTSHPGAANLGGQTREITVLFVDIRGFTAMGEQMAPTALMTLLNEYLEVTTNAIFAAGGTVTMFQGDAVMAIFNAPTEQSDHARRAMQAAQAIARGIDRHNQRTGKHPLHYGIGLHTGIAVVGNVGATTTLQGYTAIGDTVNIAKRLEEHAGQDEILLSEETYRQIKGIARAEQMGEMVVKGKTQSVRALRLIGPM